MYEVRDIIIYPIKALSGIRVLQAMAHSIGFEYDRRWMLIDEHGNFITQRQVPQLSLFSQQLVDDFLVIGYRGSEFRISLTEISDEVINTKVFDDHVVTQAVNNDVNNWFSYQLQRNIRVVRLSTDTSRSHYSDLTKETYHVSFADGYPYLIIGEQSLNTLNEKLTVPIPMNRFRPNIVIAASFAHEEDEWHNFSIGQARFKNIKPCARCNVITIDQETAEINNEPTKILSSYRKVGNKVHFGTNVICKQSGLIQVGDTITFDREME